MKQPYPINSKQKIQGEIRRKTYLDNGYEIAKNSNDPLHVKACMLYWAEGSKDNNSFQFTNCDIIMHKIMIEFLEKYFPTLRNNIKAAINFYPDENNTYENVQHFWSEKLNIPKSNFNKPTDRAKYYTKPKTNKYPNGILRLQLSRTEVLFNIYGAINYYAGTSVFTEKKH